MPQSSYFALAVFVITCLAPPLLLGSCVAGVEEGCLGGDCLAPGAFPGASTSSGTSSVGGGGGGEGPCLDTTDVGDFPCNVFAALEKNCLDCHGNPLTNGAPFPLATYEDTQAQYFDTPLQRWQRMKQVIESGFMPPNIAMEPVDEQTLLSWLNDCAKPAPDDMGCE